MTIANVVPQGVRYIYARAYVNARGELLIVTSLPTQRTTGRRVLTETGWFEALLRLLPSLTPYHGEIPAHLTGFFTPEGDFRKFRFLKHKGG